MAHWEEDGGQRGRQRDVRLTLELHENGRHGVCIHCNKHPLNVSQCGQRVAEVRDGVTVAFSSLC